MSFLIVLLCPCVDTFKIILLAHTNKNCTIFKKQTNNFAGYLTISVDTNTNLLIYSNTHQNFHFPVSLGTVEQPSQNHALNKPRLEDMPSFKKPPKVLKAI